MPRQQQLERKERQLEQHQQRLLQHAPRTAVLQQHTTMLHERLQRAMQQHLQMRTQQWQQYSALLHQVSPLATLNRGYSLSFNTENSLVKSVQQLKSGDALTVRFADGHVVTEVKQIKAN